MSQGAAVPIEIACRVALRPAQLFLACLPSLSSVLFALFAFTIWLPVIGGWRILQVLLACGLVLALGKAILFFGFALGAKWRVVFAENTVSFYSRSTLVGTYELSRQHLESIGINDSAWSGPYLWLKLADGSEVILLAGVGIEELKAVETLLRQRLTV